MARPARVPQVRPRTRAVPARAHGFADEPVAPGDSHRARTVRAAARVLSAAGAWVILAHSGPPLRTGVHPRPGARSLMSQRGGLAVYVTSHGYGHLNRTVAVINRMPAEVPVTIRCHPNLFV